MSDTTAKPAPPPETPRAAIPMVLHCPECRTRHIDVGEFATKVHHTHSCQGCGLTWRPSVVATVGVQFLPGFKDEAPAASPPETSPAGRPLCRRAHGPESCAHYADQCDYLLRGEAEGARWRVALTQEQADEVCFKIAHGDPAHREWLKARLQSFVASASGPVAGRGRQP